MASPLSRTESETDRRTGHRYRFWLSYPEELGPEQDYTTREIERQITKIVNDGGFKFRVFFVAASGFLASSYSLFAVDFLSIALFYVYPPNDRLGRDPSLVIDELTLVGTILGMLVMGHLADRSGRKKWYGAELAILIVATMGMVQSSEGLMAENGNGPDRSMSIYSWVSWWRFLLGFGIGAEYPLSSIITAEWASTQSRGIMLSAVFSMQSFGRLLSLGVSLGALRTTLRNWDPEDEAGHKLVADQVWRWTVGVALIPAAIAIVLRLTIPETPRFYAAIMKDSRKGVLTAMRLYPRNGTGQEAQELNAAPTQEQDDRDKPWHAWYSTAWEYLTGPKQGWRPLFIISLLWAIMDVPWYGLTMDLSSALATLYHRPGPKECAGIAFHTFGDFPESKLQGNGTCETQRWNKDYWNLHNTIDGMIEQNAMRSILTVSIASILGSLGSILIIDFFRRKVILIVTFFVISILLAITGATLLTDKEGEGHITAIICYAILQFVFNIGPNTLIFVLAAEIFPTTYRGTCNGIAAASGKMGAILIRGIISAWKSRERALGIRLLALIPLMLLSAWISWYIPDVQYLPKSQASTEEEVAERPPTNGQLPSSIRPADRPLPDAASETSSSDASVTPRPTSAGGKPGLFSRLQNIPLENIAPSPTQVDRRKRSTEGSSTR
ncbi:hypothetical protein NW754_004417 [Fusarium falciforme]|nr:hypothetical protein NW754_004417 [Fusarium falciforme]